ncbi:HPF/RaiA family ribosome-associated protein [Candidatus Woesearchaeota archaeon]|nr:HPF/RaiA family ribosome-associated protein [Candidatus Woesearchaeota archaeon]
MEPIQVIGIELLGETEKGIANKLVNEYYQKIFRELQNVTSITVHIKAHSKGGKKKKFDVRIKAIAPTRIFEAQESDWDLARTLHMVFRNMERELEHKLHTDSQRNKPYE